MKKNKSRENNNLKARKAARTPRRARSPRPLRRR